MERIKKQKNPGRLPPGPPPREGGVCYPDSPSLNVALPEFGIMFWCPQEPPGTPPGTPRNPQDPPPGRGGVCYPDSPSLNVALREVGFTFLGFYVFQLALNKRRPPGGRIYVFGFFYGGPRGIPQGHVVTFHVMLRLIYGTVRLTAGRSGKSPGTPRGHP